MGLSHIAWDPLRTAVGAVVAAAGTAEDLLDTALDVIVAEATVVAVVAVEVEQRQ